jgi:hypothetical protein
VTPKEISGSLDLMLVTKLSSSAHMISPTTLNKAEANAAKIFSSLSIPLTPLLTQKHLVPFVILGVNY